MKAPVFVFACAIVLFLTSPAVVRAEEDFDALVASVGDAKVASALRLLNGQVQALRKKVSLLKEDSFKEDIDDSAVLVLTGKNFDEEIAKSPLTLVEFYAPWCGHCKALAPHYAKAAKQLKDEDATGVLAKVDCTADDNKDVCEKYEVRGYPTIKLVRSDGSDPVDYDDGRTADAIVAYMKKASLPAVTMLESEAEIAAFVPEASVKIAGHYTTDAELEAFTKVAEKLRGEFAFCAVKSSVKASKVVVHTDHSGSAVFDDVTDVDGLTAFIKAEAFPPVGTIGPENYSQYLARGFSFVWTFYDAAKQEDLIEKQVVPVAQKHKSKLSFVKLDGNQWASHAENMGVKKVDPGVVLEDRETKRNYIFPEDQELTEASLGKWIDDFLAGNLQPHVKTEEEPEKNDGPVTVVVGKTFEKIAYDDSKNVLVEFYAPWCGHCKALAPEFDKLGEQYADADDVVIAKVDATANDVPEEIQGFPTLIFYPAGAGKEGVPFEGDRTAAGMAEFIEANKKAAAGKEDL